MKTRVKYSCNIFIVTLTDRLFKASGRLLITTLVLNLAIKPKVLGTNNLAEIALKC